MQPGAPSRKVKGQVYWLPGRVVTPLIGEAPDELTFWPHSMGPRIVVGGASGLVLTLGPRFKSWRVPGPEPSSSYKFSSKGAMVWEKFLLSRGSSRLRSWAVHGRVV